MLVKFRRKWFGPDGKLYGENGALLCEVPDGLRSELPSDAIVMSEDGTLPSDAVPAMPGFGAKPAQEQILDQIPGAAPTHQIGVISANPQGLHPPKNVGKFVSVEEAAADKEKRRDEIIAANAPKVAEAQAATAAASAAAKEMALKQAQATGDPSRIREAEALSIGTPAEEPIAETESPPATTPQVPPVEPVVPAPASTLSL